MNTEKVFPFLRDIAENNSREWFMANKSRYIEASDEFRALVEQAILIIGEFDPMVLYLTPKDCIYRFYRDIRFSPDKSPYKRHMGAYICAHGKSSLYGGYYVHVQPGNSFLAAGAYCMPTNILTACRHEIMANIDTWRACVESKKFLKYFGRAVSQPPTPYTDAMPARGFGSSAYLKKCPKDFPADYPFVDYLRMRDYCCWVSVADTFWQGDAWRGPLRDIFRTAKPANDFINAVIADYV